MIKKRQTKAKLISRVRVINNIDTDILCFLIVIIIINIFVFARNRLFENYSQTFFFANHHFNHYRQFLSISVFDELPIVLTLSC